ncbi:uncharacterized protein LOC110063126 [Orbicella faveolata]|uniref:uncharacterized protein LOC110063126 n=1 Tax=Orbicella faveolata TaxID=48498 RepID=UPI0009E46A13|nr:uncharacterized protein LOC110063126 [Orbicella faveolata]
MSREVFDFFKSERDICVKTIIPNQNTIFMLIPALTNRFFYFWFIDGGERGSLSRRRERDHRRGKIDENDFKFKENARQREGRREFESEEDEGRREELVMGRVRICEGDLRNRLPLRKGECSKLLVTVFPAIVAKRKNRSIPCMEQKT